MPENAPELLSGFCALIDLSGAELSNWTIDTASDYGAISKDF